MQASRGNRKGANFTVRWTDDERAAIERMRAAVPGPAALGPWLVWAASSGTAAAGAGSAHAWRAAREEAAALPVLAGQCPDGGAVPGPGSAGARHGSRGGSARPRLILDLCGGSGSWSRPYLEAGYRVDLVTLPDGDVRTYRPPSDVWAVLAAPPCNEFSILKRSPRNFALGLETVCACLRIIAEARPTWWALENPGSGMLRRWLGPPRDVWQPHEFGDPWTKLTAIWGTFARPKRSHVRPVSGMPGRTAAERAVTPPGFARAFFAANP